MLCYTCQILGIRSLCCQFFFDSLHILNTQDKNPGPATDFVDLEIYWLSLSNVLEVVCSWFKWTSVCASLCLGYDLENSTQV
jgi:hypothetical protein